MQRSGEVKPVRCVVGGRNGDCFRACIASIVERPAREVPHFFDGLVGSGDGDEGVRRAREWLRLQGFGLFMTYCSAGWPLEKVLSCYSTDNPGVPIIIAGKSGTCAAETHAVVALNGKVAHDPSGAGVAGPWPCTCKPDCELEWWWIYVIAAMPCEMEEARCAA
jgi:hypothetical protein